MSNSSRSLGFVCRSCRQAISQSKPKARLFSNSAFRPNTVPKFESTSLPELDALFLDWRRRVFTPAALNTNHQALVYKKSRHQIIENDPGVTVTMSDGEDVKLEPLNAFDKPNKKQSLHKIADLLGSSQEGDAWSQLPAFLEGMKSSHQPVPMWFLEKITRKANEQGRAGVIKQCAAMVKKTGVSLGMQPITRELFLGCHERFIEARQKGKDFEKEAKFAEGLALMLETKDHCGGTAQTSDTHVDMRRDLTVLGVLLQLSAAKAVTSHKGKDVTGTVGSLARSLVAIAQEDVVRRDEKDRPEQAIENWIPLIGGLKLASQVNGLVVGKGKNAEAEMKLRLRKYLEQLENAIEQESAKVKAASPDKPRRAMVMLDNFKQASL